ncbi:hypothetical protein [Leuconostoc holzapfelii]|uniref:hypothetical protein n=1 Tax=Leuconostoc holzapfelii TaxID=434464 RepID=UPI0021C0999B|nr:hypothetical protein [Leuconostoc holzapfelii]
MDRKQAKKLSNIHKAAKANGVKKERMSREEYKGAIHQDELRKEHYFIHHILNGR